MSTNPRWRHAILLLAILFGLAVLILSVSPLNRTAIGTRPHHRATHADVVKADRFHVFVHLTLFGALAATAWLAAGAMAKSHRSAVVAKVSALAIICFIGYATELLQHLNFHNPLEVNDVFTDVVGALVAVALCESAHQVRRNLAANAAGRTEGIRAA